jgi:hypothetical protein
MAVTMEEKGDPPHLRLHEHAQLVQINRTPVVRVDHVKQFAQVGSVRG